MIRYFVKNSEDAFRNAVSSIINPAAKLIALGEKQEIVGVLLLNRSNVVLVSTRPSNNVEPSPCDIENTERLRDALKLLDIDLIDHLIIASDKSRYYSFSEARTFDAPELVALRRRLMQKQEIQQEIQNSRNNKGCTETDS